MGLQKLDFRIQINKLLFLLLKLSYCSHKTSSIIRHHHVSSRILLKNLFKIYIHKTTNIWQIRIFRYHKLLFLKFEHLFIINIHFNQLLKIRLKITITWLVKVIYKILILRNNATQFLKVYLICYRCCFFFIFNNFWSHTN